MHASVGRSVRREISFGRRYDRSMLRRALRVCPACYRRRWHTRAIHMFQNTWYHVVQRAPGQIRHGCCFCCGGGRYALPHGKIRWPSLALPRTVYRSHWIGLLSMIITSSITLQPGPGPGPGRGPSPSPSPSPRPRTSVCLCGDICAPQGVKEKPWWLQPSSPVKFNSGGVK